MKRDKENALLGGVCAGIAKSFGMPVLMVRLLFLISMLWLGLPLIVYPILWLLMPVADSTESKSLDFENMHLDTFERSSDDAIFGGVCGGIGKSLNIDPLILRVGFIILFVCFGYGILPYAILWLFMPLHKSENTDTAEKSTTDTPSNS